MIASAQFSGPGFYRVHNAFTRDFISIKGTKFNWSKNPDAFWPCILMQSDSAQCSDPGSIIYIPSMTQTSLCAQGVSTYSLTGLPMDIELWTTQEEGLDTYIAKTKIYNEITATEVNGVFREFGFGLSAGTSPRYQEAHWWIEPVNLNSIETSFLGVKPATEQVKDADGCYWTSITCDFPFLLPLDGGVEGAYTVKEVTLQDDSLFCARAVKLYGQGDTVPAATPVLLKCKSPYVSGNKIVPVGQIANATQMPLASDLLMGNYFSNFINHSSFTVIDQMAEYIPEQATAATDDYLALGVDDQGRLGFFPQPQGSYMVANTAWLNIGQLGLKDVTAVYLVEGQDEPGEPVDPEPVVVTGDANGDGMVNVSDVVILITYLSEPGKFEDGTRSELTIDLDAADVNKDGKVNITDVVLLTIMLSENE